VVLFKEGKGSLEEALGDEGSHFLGVVGDGSRERPWWAAGRLEGGLTPTGTHGIIGQSSDV
jgi:hypothetical protein